MIGAPVVAVARRADVPRVHAIASRCFERPWDRQVFVEELCRDFAHLLVLRAREGAPIVAYVSYWLVRDEVHVLSLATDPTVRRVGYARALLEEALTRSVEAGARYASLEVRRTNAAALALYRSLGFEPLGVRPGYYTEESEDAVVMLLPLADPGGVPFPAPASARGHEHGGHQRERRRD